jgi:hypothetical protein
MSRYGAAYTAVCPSSSRLILYGKASYLRFVGTVLIEPVIAFEFLPPVAFFSNSLSTLLYSFLLQLMAHRVPTPGFYMYLYLERQALVLGIRSPA